MKQPIYLDYASTTPVDPQVAEKMADCLTLTGNFGNPASRSHGVGWRAEAAVEQARGQVADLIGADPREIIWTSGATESDNLALKGAAHFYQNKGQHIITSRIEHQAVLGTCRQLEREGFRVTYLSPDKQGVISPQAVADAIEADTTLVSIMQVNNELGAINDIAAIGEITRSKGVLLHVDAAQSVGRLAINLSELPVDLMSLSGHKMYGPKGIGVLYVRRKPPVQLTPQMHGGNHERGMRAGTLPTHQIVGMGMACQLIKQQRVAEQTRMQDLRARLLQGLADLPGAYHNGSEQQSVPGIINLSFAHVEGESLMMALKDLAVSSGSACTSASVEPSYVLKALGVDDELAHSAIRFSMGRFTTADEVDYAIDQVRYAVTKLRK
jgi:cysteine desulfurase